MIPATSLVCIYKNPFEKTEWVAGIQRKLPRNLQSKSQQMPSHGAGERRSFGSSGSDSMKPTLLLSDEIETTRLMLKDVPFDELSVRDTQPHVGCNCDRLAIPVPGASCTTPHPARKVHFHHESNSEVTKWNA
jgi:hypothetical protein